MATPPKAVTVTVTLYRDEAMALAQFVKRLTWSGMRECATGELETYQIRYGIDSLQRALADAGFAPR